MPGLSGAPRADPEPPSFGSVGCVIFDLDDTLFDCYHQCVLPAHREAAAAMRRAGLEGSLEAIAALRLELRSGDPGAPLEARVAGALGMGSTLAIVEAGQRAFFERDPGALEAFLETQPLLDALGARGRRVALVTRGHAPTQRLKLARLGLVEAFDAIEIVELGASKGPELERACQGFEAGAVLVVGDNARDEVAEALSRGYRACWVARGEFAATVAPAAWRVDGLGELLRWVGAAPTDLVEASPGGEALG